MKTIEVSGNLSDIKNYDNFLRTIGKVFSYFAEHFGKETMSKIGLYIDNAVDNEKSNTGYTPIITPILKKYLIIKLGISDFNDTEKIVYQFSHELCHYVFYSLMGIDKPKATEREESICSAMSLIIIKSMFPENFSSCYDHVCGVIEDHYRKGAEVAREMDFDINNLKALIFRECSESAYSFVI